MKDAYFPWPAEYLISWTRRRQCTLFWLFSLIGVGCLLGAAVPAWSTPVSPTGGGGGGTRFDVACAPGEVVAGVYGKAGLWLDGIGLKCVQVKGGVWSAAPTGRGYTGGTGGEAFERLCPHNSAVSGFKGKRGQYVESLEIECRVLTNATQTTGAPMYLPAVGVNPLSGTPFGPLGCPHNQPAGGAYGKSGIYLDSLGFVCMNQSEWRPRFHFSPNTGWMNDPSGLVYADGWYHLFYQAIPGSTTFSPKNVVWDHAVSRDLITWQQTKIGDVDLKPVFSLREGWAPFTGSAVALDPTIVGQPPCRCQGAASRSCVVAIYTRHMIDLGPTYNKEVQVVAPSCDAGFTFTNPDAMVLDNKDYTPVRPHFRDPKVSWYQDPRDPAGGFWIMAVAAGDRVKLFSSQKSENLMRWTPLSDITIYPTYETAGPFIETPDLVQLPVENTGTSKWVLIFGEGFIPPVACRDFFAQNSLVGGLLSKCEGLADHPSRGLYLIGDFNGKDFTAEISPGNRNRPLIDSARPLDAGPDLYAAQVWSNLPSATSTLPNVSSLPSIAPGTIAPGTFRDPPRPIQPRHIFAGWQNNWRYAHILPTIYWRGNLSIPRELGIVKDPDGHVLIQRPIREIALLRGGAGHVQKKDLAISGTLAVPEFHASSFDADMAIDVQTADLLTVQLRAGEAPERIVVGWRRTGPGGAGELFLDRGTAFGAGGEAPQGFADVYRAGLKVPDGVLKLRILVDRSSVEAFGGDGRMALSAIFFPDPSNREFRISAQGNAKLLNLDLFELDK